MAKDEEGKSDIRESPTDSKETQAPKAHPKRKGRGECKENVPPRRNPMRQVRSASKEAGAGTSQSDDIDDADSGGKLPIVRRRRKKVMPKKKFVFTNQTIEEILQEKEKLVEENRKMVELQAKLDHLKAMFLDFRKRCMPKLWVPHDSTINCKHLTPDQIKESFEKHKDELSKIFNEKVYHRRHAAFYAPCKLKENMIVPIGLSLFKYEQLELMISNMIKVFDPEAKPKMWKYFFQVLAPELCVMIFMDTYNVTRDEAMDYLAPYWN